MFDEPYAHISHRQEEFSGAYIRALCAVAGCAIERTTLDNDKIDFIVSSRVRGKVLTKPKIDIQAKCKLTAPAAADSIPYALDIETYENLRDPLVSNPRILVLVLVPEPIEQWVEQTESQLALKHCAYWTSLKGRPKSENTTSQTVHFQRKCIFTANALREMMERTSNGEELL